MISGLTAACYSAAYQKTSMSRRGAGLRCASIAAVAVLSLLRAGPPILTAALALTALAEAFRERRSKAAIAVGLAAGLTADLDYAALFFQAGGGRAALIAEPGRGLAVALMFALSVMLTFWLWGRLRTRPRWTVKALSAVLTLTVAVAFTLPHYLWPAAFGAPCLFAAVGARASEGCQGRGAVLGAQASWWFTFAGADLIAWAFLQ